MQGVLRRTVAQAVAAGDTTALRAPRHRKAPGDEPAAASATRRPRSVTIRSCFFLPPEGAAKIPRSWDWLFSYGLPRTNVEGMNATVGDRLLVHGSTVGERDRSGVIVEVQGQNGGPPYMVRFDDGHTGLVFPGPDALIVPK
ncbi:DUF1918 domain-containing protein [Nonomuraea sp. NPDC049480]|uniref:DUF1918 domain-containing protein n=1 Tax=Nonomuraea sp. NPDC049480 TaxID=3364353 RepID=UPI00379D4C88